MGTMILFFLFSVLFTINQDMGERGGCWIEKGEERKTKMEDLWAKCMTFMVWKMQVTLLFIPKKKIFFMFKEQSI